MLGISEYHLGDLAQARAAFVNLLSHDPDYALDPFLVPPAIVEFFDQVKREHEAALAPLRERKRALQERAAAGRRGQAQAPGRGGRSAPARPRGWSGCEEHHYFFNWLPLGAGQFQNGDRAKGTAIAAGAGRPRRRQPRRVPVATTRSPRTAQRSCVSTASPAARTRPTPTRTARLLQQIDIVKYVSAGMFWALYVYGVWDAHHNYVPLHRDRDQPRRQAARR